MPSKKAKIIKKRSSLDPITLELIRCRLEAGARQMAVTLWKSSYSTVIREVLDYSTAIFDSQGRMVAQSAQLPFQMMTMVAPLQHLQGRGFDWQPGDVVLLNDPYDCDAQHLPDVMTFRAVFHRGKVIGFTGAVAHMIDIGGGAPGSYLATATEIFQEGLRLPPVKIINRGKKNAEIFDIIRLNIREPEKTIGDMNAMIACTAVGEQTLHELISRYGADSLSEGMAEIQNGSERLLRARIKELPNGTYRAVDYVDDDGIGDEPIRVNLALIVKDGSIVADFEGSSPQMRGPVNATLPMTESAVHYTIMAAFGRGIAKNDGCRRVVRVKAPERCALNCRFPAPIVSRVTICHRVVDAILQALAQVMPDKVVAGYYGVSNICNLGGFDQKTHKPWIHFEVEIGGWGARPNSDGLDGFSAHLHNMSNTPVEVVETTNPIRVERYELIPGSGGNGKHRGGLGLRRDMRVLSDNVSLNLLGDHSKIPPKGLLGGKDGKGGRYILNPETPGEIVLANKLSNYPMKLHDVISMQTPGGGGYGDPAQRSQSLIEQDRQEGKA